MESSEMIINQMIHEKKDFLEALLSYAYESVEFNPHFLKSEFTKINSMSDEKFDLIQKRLGDKYCYYVGNERYAINLKECQNLWEQYKKETKQYNEKE